jgi:hypothetical protein
MGFRKISAAVVIAIFMLQTFLIPVSVISVSADEGSAPAFADVQEDYWAYTEIQTLTDKQIVKGNGVNKFFPNQKVTRAQFTTLLVRALKLQSGEFKGAFSDVKETDWFAKDIETAEEAGIVNGYNDGTFKPADYISREQMVLMLMNANQYATDKLTTDISKGVSIDDFSDNAKISSWAIDSVKAAYDLGILSGRSDSTFAPKMNATRAEAAKVLYMALELIVDQPTEAPTETPTDLTAATPAP